MIQTFQNENRGANVLPVSVSVELLASDRWCQPCFIRLK